MARIAWALTLLAVVMTPSLAARRASNTARDDTQAQEQDQDTEQLMETQSLPVEVFHALKNHFRRPPPLPRPARRILPSHVRPYMRPQTEPQPPRTPVPSPPTHFDTPGVLARKEPGLKPVPEVPPSTPYTPPFTSPKLVVADGDLPPYTAPTPEFTSPMLVVADGDLKQEPNTPYSPPFIYPPRPAVAFADGNPQQEPQPPNTPYPPPFIYPPRPAVAFADGNPPQGVADGNSLQKPQQPSTPYIFVPEYPPRPALNAEEHTAESSAPDAKMSKRFADGEYYYAEGVPWFKLPRWPTRPNAALADGKPKPEPQAINTIYLANPARPAPDAGKSAQAPDAEYYYAEGVPWFKLPRWPTRPDAALADGKPKPEPQALNTIYLANPERPAPDAEKSVRFADGEYYYAEGTPWFKLPRWPTRPDAALADGKPKPEPQATNTIYLVPPERPAPDAGKPPQASNAEDPSRPGQNAEKPTQAPNGRWSKRPWPWPFQQPSGGGGKPLMAGAALLAPVAAQGSTPAPEEADADAAQNQPHALENGSQDSASDIFHRIDETEDWNPAMSEDESDDSSAPAPSDSSAEEQQLPEQGSEEDPSDMFYRTDETMDW